MLVLNAVKGRRVLTVPACAGALSLWDGNEELNDEKNDDGSGAAANVGVGAGDMGVAEFVAAGESVE